MRNENVKELLKKIEKLEERLTDSRKPPENYFLQSGDYAYRVLIEEIGEGALNTREDGMIAYANSSFLELLGLPYDQVAGRFISEFVQEESIEKFGDLFRESLHGRSNGEINLCVGTKITPVYISMTSLQPKLASVGIIVTDQTLKKLNEQTILRYQKELELKNAELEQNNVELTAFTYIASHDLQEPLRKIKTFCNLILSHSTEPLPDKTLDYIQRVVKASKRMQVLISSLLNYSRMNVREMEIERADLNNILDEVCSTIREQLDESQTVIQNEPLPVISCVPLQINQLFTNLIINSIKYKKQGIAPLIQITSRLMLPEKMEAPVISTQESGYWKITFSDNGIGFEQQYADKIFELFQRLHSRVEYEGTGIGLAICKKIVQNHKGLIRAEGRPGLGASFDIYLPAGQ